MKKYHFEVTDTNDGQLVETFVHYYTTEESNEESAILKLSAKLGERFTKSWHDGIVTCYDSESSKLRIYVEEWETSKCHKDCMSF